jgi:hypothetical protein
MLEAAAAAAACAPPARPSQPSPGARQPATLSSLRIMQPGMLQSHEPCGCPAAWLGPARALLPLPLGADHSCTLRPSLAVQSSTVIYTVDAGDSPPPHPCPPPLDVAAFCCHCQPPLLQLLRLWAGPLACTYLPQAHLAPPARSAGAQAGHRPQPAPCCPRDERHNEHHLTHNEHHLTSAASQERGVCRLQPRRRAAAAGGGAAGRPALGAPPSHEARVPVGWRCWRTLAAPLGACMEGRLGFCIIDCIGSARSAACLPSSSSCGWPERAGCKAATRTGLPACRAGSAALVGPASG